MVNERISGYQPPKRAEYQREPSAQEVRRENPAEVSPDEQRAASIAKKPRPAVKILGNKIDVYA
ncbi:MAG: hypothetical protein EOM80_07635 [Erysipelotrichia bacterium]|nr:hypothetical protein [Candidatus Riflebacteria bacterium]NCB38625.1 hypothetical protein [Erysipelotrichia bacterium]